MERKYYWIITKDPDPPHKDFLIKGGWSEQEARDKAFSMLGGLEFEIRGLRTTNQGTASAMLRGKILENTSDLRQAKQRIGHNRSLRRLIKRRQFGS